MSSQKQTNCMNCGEPIKECNCVGCQICGRPDCEHLKYRAKIMTKALASIIETAKLIEEDRKK
jgi:hypothetical protein